MCDHWSMFTKVYTSRLSCSFTSAEWNTHTLEEADEHKFASIFKQKTLRRCERTREMNDQRNEWQQYDVDVEGCRRRRRRRNYESFMENSSDEICWTQKSTTWCLFMSHFMVLGVFESMAIASEWLNEERAKKKHQQFTQDERIHVWMSNCIHFMVCCVTQEFTQPNTFVRFQMKWHNFTHYQRLDFRML